MLRNVLMASQTQPLLTQCYDLLTDFPLCHQFSIYIGFSSESISNAFLQTLCHQLWHHGDLYKTPTIPTQRCTQEHCDILRCALFI